MAQIARKEAELNQLYAERQKMDHIMAWHKVHKGLREGDPEVKKWNVDFSKINQKIAGRERTLNKLRSQLQSL